MKRKEIEETNMGTVQREKDRNTNEEKRER
jgi:hypothetical protein